MPSIDKMARQRRSELVPNIWLILIWAPVLSTAFSAYVKNHTSSWTRKSLLRISAVVSKFLNRKFDGNMERGWLWKIKMNIRNIDSIDIPEFIKYYLGSVPSSQLNVNGHGASIFDLDRQCFRMWCNKYVIRTKTREWKKEKKTNRTIRS